MRIHQCSMDLPYNGTLWKKTPMTRRLRLAGERLFLQFLYHLNLFNSFSFFWEIIKYICVSVTSRHWDKASNWSVNHTQLINKGRVTHMRRQTKPSLLKIMACHLLGAKPLSQTMLIYCKLSPWEQISVKFESKENVFENVVWEMASVLSGPRRVNAIDLWPLLLTWVNFNLSMDK